MEYDRRNLIATQALSQMLVEARISNLAWRALCLLLREDIKAARRSNSDPKIWSSEDLPLLFEVGHAHGSAEEPIEVQELKEFVQFLTDAARAEE